MWRPCSSIRAPGRGCGRWPPCRRGATPAGRRYVVPLAELGGAGQPERGHRAADTSAEDRHLLPVSRDRHLPPPPRAAFGGPSARPTIAPDLSAVGGRVSQCPATVRKGHHHRDRAASAPDDVSLGHGHSSSAVAPAGRASSPALWVAAGQLAREAERLAHLTGGDAIVDGYGHQCEPEAVPGRARVRSSHRSRSNGWSRQPRAPRMSFASPAWMATIPPSYWAMSSTSTVCRLTAASRRAVIALATSARRRSAPSPQPTWPPGGSPGPVGTRVPPAAAQFVLQLGAEADGHVAEESRGRSNRWLSASAPVRSRVLGARRWPGSPSWPGRGPLLVGRPGRCSPPADCRSPVAGRTSGAARSLPPVIRIGVLRYHPVTSPTRGSRPRPSDHLNCNLAAGSTSAIPITTVCRRHGRRGRRLSPRRPKRK